MMYPMISCLTELEKANELVNEYKNELNCENLPYNNDLEIGVMVEIPAAALIADTLGKRVKFFSVGTNDLIQYSLAIDRANRDVAYLYRPLHLGVLRMVQSAVEGARQAGIEISMCGEMAGDPAYSLVLLALGLDVLSMNPADIPAVKRVMRAAELRDARELLEAAMCFSSVDEIERFVVEQMRKRFPQLIAEVRDGAERPPATADPLSDVQLKAGS